MSVRRATHAGSWYSDSRSELNQQLSRWLSEVNVDHGPARAIISPHAGYQYCGSCAAFAYRQVDPGRVRRVFILGPSHHVRLPGCALSTYEKYATPFYDLVIDQHVYQELKRSGKFEQMSASTDEDEHSIEMQLPMIAKMMERYATQFTVVPILVGSLVPEKEAMYGSVLAPYLDDPSNLFVISSDFCHWGQRFRYTYFDRSCGEIHRSISKLDRTGMDLIEQLSPKGFTEYLKKYGNTICGRHPIGVLLNAVESLRKTGNGHNMSLKFLKYSQSSQCYSMSDSSVSYAAASFVVH